MRSKTQISMEALYTSTGVVALAEMGNKFAEKIPMKLVHTLAAGIFAVMGVLALLKVEKLFQ